MVRNLLLRSSDGRPLSGEPEDFKPLLVGPYPNHLVSFIQTHADIVQDYYRRVRERGGVINLSLLRMYLEHLLVFELELSKALQFTILELHIEPMWVFPIPRKAPQLFAVIDDCHPRETGDQCGGCGACFASYRDGFRRLVYQFSGMSLPDTRINNTEMDEMFGFWSLSTDPSTDPFR